MADDLRQMLARLKCSSGASDSSIRESEAKLGFNFPVEYIAFLKLTNGGEGFIGEEYAIFWNVEELAEANADYQVHEYAAGLLIFGSNGGGEAYGFDTRREPWPVVRMPFVGMNWGQAISIGDSFSEFLERLHGAE